MCVGVYNNNKKQNDYIQKKAKMLSIICLRIFLIKDRGQKEMENKNSNREGERKKRVITNDIN